jgi:hypothetical protein
VSILTEEELAFLLRSQASTKTPRKHPQRVMKNTVPTRIRTSSLRMVPALKARMVISKVKIPIVLGTGIVVAIGRPFIG